MGKWTDQGFVTNTAAFYEERLQGVFQDAFGTDFLIDKTTPQGVLITRLVELFYNMDMDGVEGFSRLNLNTASGIYLDIIGKLRGVERNLGTPQMATVKVVANPVNFIAFTVPAGQEFRNLSTGDVFVTKRIETINSDEGTIYLEYNQTGNSESSVGDKLQTDGLSQITDLEITFLADGLGEETDIEYRNRLLNSTPVARNTIEFIQNKLLALPYVKTVGCNYNDTAETVGELPPYTTEFMAVPKLGTDIDGVFKPGVADVILNNKVPGSPTAGNTEVTATDVFGTQKQVLFTIPTAIELEIDVRVTTPETTGVLDLSRVTEHVTVIEKYINALNIGKEVSYSRCIAPLASDHGFDIQWFRIRKVGDEQWVENANYSIGLREYASIVPSRITIGV